MATVFRVQGTMLPSDASADVLIREGVFVSDADPDDRVETLATGVFITPGLVDAHAHLQIASPVEGSPAAMAAASAREHLRAGVLVIREPGGPAGSSTGVDPDHGLPRLQTAGRFLAPEGRYIGFQRSVSGEELADAAVDELSRSTGWAKVVMDWIDPSSVRISPNYSYDSLAAATQAVHAAGGRLAVHAAHPGSVNIAIAAGVDSIEHGLTISADDASEMASKGIALTPTAVGMLGVPDLMANLGAPDDEVAWWAGVVERFPATIREAHEAGVRILAGTDAGMGPHGEIRHEIAYLRAAGMPADAALAAGSWDARDYLGFPNIEIEAPADLVAYATDPREDLDALADPALMVLDGRVVSYTEPLA